VIPRFGRTAAAYACAVLLAGGSFYTYATRYQTAGRWQAADFDPADYRIIAEHFWGVPVALDTYRIDPGWLEFLQHVPFRGIGLGTFYLLAGATAIGHAPSTNAEVVAAGARVAVVEKILLAVALLMLFEVARRSWGAAAAVGAIAATALPPRFWRLTDDFLAEPLLRVCFLLLFACAIAFSRRKSTTLAIAMLTLMFIAAHLKADWVLGTFLLLPVLFLEPSMRRAPVGARIAVCALAIATPISIAAVNWIGWHTASMRPGLGVHVNLKYNDTLRPQYCANLSAGEPPPPFCDEHRPKRSWWRMYLGGDVSLAEIEAFDQYARGILVATPARDVREFAAGLALASSVPGIAVDTGPGLFRVVPLANPWAAIVRVLDVGVWVLLFIGLRDPELRAPCATALVLWIVPSAGNMVSLYELRYHMPMAGIGLVCACQVLARVAARHYPKNICRSRNRAGRSSA